ncbi:MAG: hypothetical protein ACRDKJ_04680, partial [Actinomycetota bacterium]
MRRASTLLLAVATLLPAGGSLAAVSMTPPSANAFPVFEISTSKGPVRVAATELGARRTSDGLGIDEKRFAHGVERLAKVFNRPAEPATYELIDNRVHLKTGHSGFELDADAFKVLLLRALRGSRSGLKLPTRELPAPAPPEFAIVVRLDDFMLD